MMLLAMCWFFLLIAPCETTHILSRGEWESKHADVTEQLRSETNIDELEDWQKYVTLVFDEVKIKEGIVYNKHDCKIVGFIDLGPINNILLKFENSLSDVSTQPMSVASHMLTFMVRGLFIHLQFPYAYYPTDGVTADLLFPIVWEVVRNLECAGFKVISVTGDGVSQNRKIFRMHKLACSCELNPDTAKPITITHKVRNPYSMEDRYLYFFVDVPHLIKTVRNCWSNSFGHSYTRALWVCKKGIMICIIIFVYYKCTD